MPLLAETTVTIARWAWTFIHIWRVCDGLIVEHWACRDDMGLLEQLRLTDRPPMSAPILFTRPGRS
jgi:lactoylglutathione lyase